MSDRIRPGSGSNARGRGRKKAISGTPTPVTAITLVPKNQQIRRSRDGVTEGILSSVAGMIEGGKNALMELARFAPEIEPGLSSIIEDWDKLSKDGRKKASLDAMCKAREVDPFHFFGVVSEVSLKYRDNATLLIAALSLPKIIQKASEYAQDKDGFRFAEALMKHSGFLPVPAGATFVNTLNTKVETNVGDNPASHLPSFEQTVDSIDIGTK